MKPIEESRIPNLINAIACELRQGNEFCSASEMIEDVLAILEDFKNVESNLSLDAINYLINGLRKANDMIFDNYNNDDIAYIISKNVIVAEGALQESNVLKYRLEKLKYICAVLFDFFADFDIYADFFHPHSSSDTYKAQSKKMDRIYGVIAEIDDIIDADPGTDKNTSFFIKNLLAVRQVLAIVMTGLFTSSRSSIEYIDGESCLRFIKELVSNHIDYTADTEGEFGLKDIV